MVKTLFFVVFLLWSTLSVANGRRSRLSGISISETSNIERAEDIIENWRHRQSDTDTGNKKTSLVSKTTSTVESENVEPDIDWILRKYSVDGRSGVEPESRLDWDLRNSRKADAPWETDFYSDGGIEAEKELNEHGEYEIQPSPVVKSVLGRNSAIEHLQDIASLQFNIMTLLRKIERQNRGNKRCSASSLKEQQAAITEMQVALDMKVPQLSEKQSSLSKKTRIYRLISTTDQRNAQLRQKLEQAKKKRARLIELINYLKTFRDYNKLQGVDSTNISYALRSLEGKVCSEVVVESKELAELCREIHTEVKDRRKDVMDLLETVLETKPQPSRDF